MGLIGKIKNKFYVKKVLRKENTFSAEEKVKYILLEDAIKSDDEELIVVFSGFPGRNKPASYNYMSTLKKIKKNKLFILDDFGRDKRGAYYLGKHKEFNIYTTVTKLINSICEKKNYCKITTVGSSKGGYAALFFAFKNNYYRCIVSEPQFLLGNYLSTEDHKSIFEYIAGEINTSNVNYLNELLEIEINKSSSHTVVLLYYGKFGSYKNDHIYPLLKTLDKNNIEVKCMEDNYSDHHDLVNFFPKHLQEILK
ncbi:hypothetical protein SAMN04487887_101231 [Enterococcus casseliflavus]|uniref:hypothetical protein n=1 Tax=Enterococcus casseliflavus TaxID=37734 RepID=UPI0008EC96B5|nr:hypothetical protein [Enterococcus casseliflavus]SFD37232.1 hypothetical protein SAMN04487887_101231 [Enterococcus casseliflavus]